MAEEPGTSIIDDDRPCIHCGYNLRGLSISGMCPECGKPITHSLHDDMLSHADPDWLDRIRLGVNLRLWGLVVGILVGMGVGIAVGVLSLNINPGGGQNLFGLIAGTLGLWAAFLITTQDPRVALREKTVTLRTVVRTCAAAGFLGNILNMIAYSGILPTVLAILGGALALAGFFAALGEFVYLRRLALRIPDPQLALSTKRFVWMSIVLGIVGFAVVVAVAIGSGVFSGGTLGGTNTFSTSAGVSAGGSSAGGPLSGTSPPPSMGTAPVLVASCSVLVLGVIGLIWYVRLLIRYRKAFLQAAEQSRAQPTG